MSVVCEHISVLSSLARSRECARLNVSVCGVARGSFERPIGRHSGQPNLVIRQCFVNRINLIIESLAY